MQSDMTEEGLRATDLDKMAQGESDSRGKCHSSPIVRPAPAYRVLTALRALAVFLTLACLTRNIERCAAATLPTVPGAVGFGGNTVGGSGRHLNQPKAQVFTVLSLNESGKGTLRECVEATVPRICIIARSGVVHLRKALVVKAPYLTIFGQAAPAPGLTITGAGIILKTHDVAIQHIALRIGDDPKGPPPGSRDGIAVVGGKDAYNIFLDHLSVAWAIDENVSIWGSGAHDITLSNSIVAESLDSALHPKGAHSKAFLIGDGVTNVSVVHNLFALNRERNPYIADGSSVELADNLIYGWGGKGSFELVDVSDYKGGKKGVSLDLYRNFFKPGPQSFIGPPIWAHPVSPTTRIFTDENSFFLPPSSKSRTWKDSVLEEILYRSEKPLLRPTVLPEIGGGSGTVLSSAGSRPFKRNEIDEKIVRSVSDGSGTIKHCVLGCAEAAGPWPKLGGVLAIPKLPKDPHKVLPSGYTAIEDLMHELARNVENGSHR